MEAAQGKFKNITAADIRTALDSGEEASLTFRRGRSAIDYTFSTLPTEHPGVVDEVRRIQRGVPERHDPTCGRTLSDVERDADMWGSLYPYITAPSRNRIAPGRTSVSPAQLNRLRMRFKVSEDSPGWVAISAASRFQEAECARLLG